MKIKQIFLMVMGVVSFSSGSFHAASAPGGPKVPVAQAIPGRPQVPAAPAIPVAPAPLTPPPAVKIGAPIPTAPVAGIPAKITVETPFADVKKFTREAASIGDGQWLERNLNVIADTLKLEVRRGAKLESIAAARDELIKAIRNLRGDTRKGSDLAEKLANKTTSLELKKVESTSKSLDDESLTAVEPDPVEDVTLTTPIKVKGSDVDTVSRILKVAIRIAELQHALPKLKPTIDGYNKKLKASKSPDEKSIYALQILFKVVKPPLVNLTCLLNELLKVTTASTVMNKLGKEGQGRMLQLAEVAKMGCRYSKDMADALMVLTQSLSARDKARKAAAARKATVMLDDMDIDDILRDADIEERKFGIVKKDIETEVDEFAPYPETELLKVLRAMSRLAGHKKRGTLESEIIALRDEMRAAELEEKAEPALKMLFKMSQPLTDVTYVLSRVVRLLARFPIVGQGFKDIATVATDVYDYTKIVDTALEDLAKSLKAREEI
ncbi:MAG TPA: hypothetical protein VGT41_03395 [Candidatus Babeliales bacterium]|nr:hypothetical protein [Candidatus Babeliales bacterium]